MISLLINTLKYLKEKENIMKVQEVKSEGQIMAYIQLKKIQTVHIKMRRIYLKN